MLEQGLNEELEQYILLNYRPDGTEEKAFAEEPKKKASTGGVLGIGAPFAACIALPEFLTGIESLAAKLEMSFSEKLMWWIKERKRKPVEIYSAAGVTKAHFAKIRNNVQYHPTKETVLAFVVALHLSMDEAADLLKRAGYALSESRLGDMIVKFFLEMKRYNIDEINEALYTHDCKTLTNWRGNK
ncbi:hypothetical protein SAMN05216582_10883 [Selenomonas ruminantium]|uniref:Uncharacterized protein n=1 Tax=Selenomonas ruminantium TaxID=971 RepID=A0A1M6TP28_SELRU|nr:Appr-1-p processing protein [Selenomonas ruminantium]SHK58558.1 hypothetical protein SAMN05216582_10883 [Selenomonas ruminantium]